MKIHKYTLNFTDDPADGLTAKLTLPSTSVLRKVHSQGKRICVWVEVDPEQRGMDETATFRAVPTGADAPNDDWSYVDTAFIDEFVWHIYVKEAK